LEKLQQAEYLVKSSEVIPVAVGDKPGGLAAVLRILADAGVDVEYTYAFVAHSRDNAYVILRVNDNSAAINALEDHGISILTEQQLYGM
jgi:hypothetical protein